MTPAVGTLLDRMRPYAARKAVAMGVPAADVEDAVQEALVKVWKASARLDDARDPWPLLAVVARQEIHRFVTRRVMPHPELDRLDDVDTEEGFEQHAALRVEDVAPEAAERAELVGLVRAAVATLPPAEREVVEAVDLREEAPAAVAERLGYSHAGGRVRQLRRAGHARLRVTLAPLVA